MWEIILQRGGGEKKVWTNCFPLRLPAAKGQAERKEDFYPGARKTNLCYQREKNSYVHAGSFQSGPHSEGLPNNS